MHRFTFQPIPTIFFILSTIVMVWLGTWQLQRLNWKQHVIAQTEEANNLPILANLPQDTSNLLYRKVLLTGAFKYDHTIHLIGRQQGMDVGYYMVTPLVLEDDGRIILVNRGFSPVGKQSEPKNPVTVEGLIRPLREKRAFSPDNVPDKNIWTYEDLDAIEKTLGQRPLDMVVEATGKHEQGVYPIPNDGKVIFRNDHLGYAVTWYGLVLTGLVMFLFYSRKKA